MSSEDEKKYKQIELKYKRMDAIARILGALAASASAVAAFLTLQNYTRSPQSPTTTVQQNIQQSPNIAPKNTAPVLQLQPNTQRSPVKSTAPATPQQNNDDDDDGDDD